MENGYGTPPITKKIQKQILKLKQIQRIFTHYGETQFLNSNSKSGVQDPRSVRLLTVSRSIPCIWGEYPPAGHTQPRGVECASP